MASVPKPTVVKDAAWLKVVRQMPCWMRGASSCDPWDTIGPGPSEASHLDGKSRDDRVLPMCGGHHRTGPISWHRGQETFCRLLLVNKDDLIARAEQMYRNWKAP